MEIFVIENEFLCMNDKKASQQSDIPTKLIKMNVDIYSNILLAEINKAFKFSGCMKIADVTPVLKKRN